VRATKRRERGRLVSFAANHSYRVPSAKSTPERVWLRPKTQLPGPRVFSRRGRHGCLGGRTRNQYSPSSEPAARGLDASTDLRVRPARTWARRPFFQVAGPSRRCDWRRRRRAPRRSLDRSGRGRIVGLRGRWRAGPTWGWTAGCVFGRWGRAHWGRPGAWGRRAHDVRGGGGRGIDVRRRGARPRIAPWAPHRVATGMESRSRASSRGSGGCRGRLARRRPFRPVPVGSRGALQGGNVARRRAGRIRCPYDTGHGLGVSPRHDSADPVLTRLSCRVTRD